MKVYISSDMEGVCGVAEWSETEHDKGGRWYDAACRQMTAEVAAACEGALAAGAEDILVKDAHDTGRNILPAGLPQAVRLNRAWSGHPFSMVDGLDESFDAVMFLGYHSPAAGDGSPLAHTMNGRIEEIRINGQRASEFLIHSYVAGMLGVPVVFASGDDALCREAQAFVPGMVTVATGVGEGDAMTSIHPQLAAGQIRQGAQRALQGDLDACRVEMPPWFEVTVRYAQHAKAYEKSFYPGARQVDEKTVGFENGDYNEVMRFFQFVL